MPVRIPVVIMLLLFMMLPFQRAETRINHKRHQTTLSHKKKITRSIKKTHRSRLVSKFIRNRSTAQSHIVELMTPKIVLSDSIRSSFINNEKNQITNPGQLSKLTEKLKKVAAPWKQVVRIVHIGDSHIQADMMTRVLRKGLQERYGNAGRGIVFPWQLAKTNGPSDIVSFSDKPWLTGRLSLAKNAVDCGVCGYGLHRDSSDVVLEIGVKASKTDDDAFDVVRLFTGRNTGCVTIKYNGSEEQIACIQPESAYGSELFPLKMKTNAIALYRQLPDSTAFDFYGVSLEKKEAPGVIYHTIGVNGAEYSSFNNAALFWQQIGALKADCYLISLGTNEAQNPNLNVDDFGAQVRRMVARLKQVSPDAVFIITTPAPSFYHRLRLNPAIKTVADELARVSSEEKISSWNLYDISGAEAGSNIFQEIGLYRPDMLHFNRAGYELQGDMLLAALLHRIKR
jgi:lysophospholipase L1-like esterase